MKRTLISILLMFLSISTAFAIDIVASLKSIVEPANNVEAIPNIFVDTDNRAMSYQEFLAKLETGCCGYSVRRDENNRIVRISLVPGSVVDSTQEPVAGDPAPLFRVISADGREFTPASLQGQVVAIKFGSSQCRPCEKDWLQIRDVPRSFQDKPVVFIYMQVEDEQASAPAGSGYITIPKQWGTAVLFNINSFPTHLVIDTKGIIQWKAKGTGQNTASELTKAISSALEKIKNGG
jgi:hypothetical protein